MKQDVIIKGKMAMFIIMIVFVSLVGMMLACGTTSKKEWIMPNITEEQSKKDNYECMQQSQQRQSASQGGYWVGNVWIPGRSESSVETNFPLYKACLEARGWRLVDRNK